MHVYVCVCLCVYTYTHTHIHTRVYVCVIFSDQELPYVTINISLHVIMASVFHVRSCVMEIMIVE